MLGIARNQQHRMKVTIGEHSNAGHFATIIQRRELSQGNVRAGDNQSTQVINDAVLPENRAKGIAVTRRAGITEDLLPLINGNSIAAYLLWQGPKIRHYFVIPQKCVVHTKITL